MDDSFYAHANLFVARYQVPSNGHIPLEKARVKLLRGIETPEGWREDKNGAWWLILQDGDFWPVMVKLSEGEIKELSKLQKYYEQIHI